MQSQNSVASRSDRSPQQGQESGSQLKVRDPADPSRPALAPSEMRVGLITGGFDRPYAYGLSMALTSMGVKLDVIGSDQVDSPEMHTTPGLNFINLQRGWRENAPFFNKLVRVCHFYTQLIRYVALSKSRLLHILWNNKIELLDRTLLMLLHKALGKRIVLTAHNVNTRQRDGNDTHLNRFSLAVQYRLTDHIFVHTQQMRAELLEQFDIPDKKVTVIPFGTNNSLPRTNLTPEDAKHRLGVRKNEFTMLFFGRIQPYKGLECLIEAMELLIRTGSSNYRLIIAGEPKKEYRTYWESIQRKIRSGDARDQVLERVEYIPDSEVEVYFQAADVFVLPYTQIYQSGVLFLGYSFGLPVIATDVGSFRQDVDEGVTGCICTPNDSASLALAIQRYFHSPMYRDLHRTRLRIREYVSGSHSWISVAELTCKVYQNLSSEAPA